MRVCGVQDPLVRGVVKQVAVLILNAHGLVVEKFIADLQVRDWEVFLAHASKLRRHLSLQSH